MFGDTDRGSAKERNHALSGGILTDGDLDYWKFRLLLTGYTKISHISVFFFLRFSFFEEIGNEFKRQVTSCLVMSCQIQT